MMRVGKEGSTSSKATKKTINMRQKFLEFINNTSLLKLVIISQLFLLLAMAFSPVKPKPFGDDYFFVEGKNISLWLKGQPIEQEIVLSKAPLPSLLYAFSSLFVSGDKWNYWAAAVVLNGLLLIVAVYYLTIGIQQLTNRNTALLNLVLISIFPLHVYYAFGMMAELPAIVATCFVIFFFSKTEAKSTFFGFLMLLLLCYARPNSILIFFVIAFVALVYFLKTRKKEVLPLLFLSVASVVVFQVSMRLLADSQKEALKGYTQEQHLWYVVHQGFYQFRDEPLNWAYWQKEFRVGSIDYINWRTSLDSIRHQDFQMNYDTKFMIQEYYFQDFLDRPIQKIRQFLTKAFYGNFFLINSKPPKAFSLFTNSGKIEYYFMNLMVNLVNIFVIIGFLIGIYRMPKNDFRFWLLLAIWLGILIFPALVYMEPRYLLPLRPIMILFAAFALTPLLTKFSKNAA